MVFAFLVWNRVWLQIYGYRFSGSGLKRGLKNNIFWSEIGSGFWEPCGTPPPKMLGSTPPSYTGSEVFCPTPSSHPFFHSIPACVWCVSDPPWRGRGGGARVLKGAVSTIIPSAPKSSSRHYLPSKVRIFWVIFVIRVLSKSSIVFLSQRESTLQSA